MLPRVTGMMLTADRQAMTTRAVRSFLSQTYARKDLLIWDTGKVPYDLPEALAQTNITVLHTNRENRTIGQMRNDFIQATPHADIYAHFDSDDWSHPSRLSQMVEQLSGSASVVGYSNMVFWNRSTEEAFVYYGENGYLIGTSLVYWRKTALYSPFYDLNAGEEGSVWQAPLARRSVPNHGVPRIIAEIHGGNTSSEIVRGHRQWARTPEWDAYCRERMAL